MSWYETLLTLHILAAAVWLGSSLAILAIGRHALAAGTGPFSTYVVHAGWWGGRAHPAAGVVILLTGMGLVAEGDWSAGDLWIVVGILGVLTGFAVGGALIGRTAGQLVGKVQGGDGRLQESDRPTAQRLLRFTAVEVAAIVVVVAAMVFKPGA